MGTVVRFSTPQKKEEKKSNIPFVLLVFFLSISFALVTIYFLNLFPVNSTATAKKGKNYLKRGEYRKALINFHLLSKDKPKKEESQIGIVKSLIAISWENYNKNGWKNYAKDKNDYMKTPEFAKAIEILKSLVESNKNSVLAHYYLGIIYGEKGWYYKAIREYEMVLKIKKDHWDAFNNIGVAYVDLDEIEMADKWFLKLIEANPEYARTYLNLAILYGLEMKKLKKAERYLSMWEKKSKNNALSYQLRRELEN